MENFWRKCSTCKKEIPFRTAYYVCSISTCRAKATDYAFCSVPCWDGHIPVERHRGDNFAAIEKRAPSREESEQASEKRRVIVNSEAAGSPGQEVLVVVSKVKKYIFDRSGGMNTSASTYQALTQRIQRLCDRAIEEARRQGRKTVMDRDIP